MTVDGHVTSQVGGRGSECPAAEVLAAYVERTTTPDVRTDVERHLVTCADCRAVVVETAAILNGLSLSQLEAGSTPLVRRGWQGFEGFAAAAVIFLAVSVVTLNISRGAPGASRDLRAMQVLVDTVNSEPLRLVDGRLSGEFDYGAPPPVMRAEGTARPVSPEVRIALAAVEQQASARNAAGQAALGVVYMIGGDLDQAVEALRNACATNPPRAPWWSDLSVAYIARGDRSRDDEDYRRALDAADRALQAAPGFGPAAFNRALALDRLSRRDEALAAWTLVEQSEANSPWAVEAASHVRALTSGR